MEKITFRCLCNITLEVERQWIGHELQCPNCGTTVLVPDSPDPQNPTTAQAVCPPAAGTNAPSGQVTVMKWLEPSIMKRHNNRVLTRWISVGIIFGMALLCVILRSIVTQGPSPHPYSYVILGGAGVGVMFDLVRRMYLFIPSFIIVSNEGINRNTMFGIGAQFEFLPWHTIGSGSVQTVALGFRAVRLLRLYSPDNEETGVIGMARSVQFHQLATEFASMGKPLTEAV